MVNCHGCDRKGTRRSFDCALCGKSFCARAVASGRVMVRTVKRFAGRAALRIKKELK